MTLKAIAFDNLIRRKSKTIFLLAGLLIGITACVALLSIAQTMKQDFEEKLDKFGANIIITPKKDELPLTYGSVTLPGLEFEEAQDISEKDISKIKKFKGDMIKIISPKLIDSAKVKGSSLIVVGLNLKLEKNLKSWWKIRGKIPVSNHEIMIGSEAAKKTNLNIGDKIAIKNTSFIISGILKETGSSDDNAVFGNLKIIQSIFNKPNKVSIAEASINDNSKIETIANNLNKRFPKLKASTVKEALKSQSDNIKMFTWFSLISSAIILFVASLIVFITMMSSVNERTREIGIFRAVGFRKTHIINIIMIEAGSISFAGGLLGSLLGYGLAILILPAIAKDIKGVPFNVLIIIPAIFLAVILGITSSYIPAKKAAGMDPAEALRFI